MRNNHMLILTNAHDQMLDSPLYYWQTIQQVPSFKSWLKDAEIIDSKNVLTEFGQFCVDNMVNDPELIWALIWINIVYNSELVGWFANNIEVIRWETNKFLVLNLG